MIRIFGLISASLVFLLLCSPIVLIPGHAWAWGCCGATCKITCTCIGTYPCVYNPDDTNTVQSDVANSDDSSEMDIAHKAPAFTATPLDLTDSFLGLTTASKCFRDKLALSLLGNSRDGLKFMTFLTDVGR